MFGLRYILFGSHLLDWSFGYLIFMLFHDMVIDIHFILI